MAAPITWSLTALPVSSFTETRDLAMSFVFSSAFFYLLASFTPLVFLWVNMLRESWTELFFTLFVDILFSLSFNYFFTIRSHSGMISNQDWLMDWSANFTYKASINFLKKCGSQFPIFCFLKITVVIFRSANLKQFLIIH